MAGWFGRRIGAKRQSTVDEFARLYYDSARRTWKNTHWLGVYVEKTPLDLWIYQELLAEIRPALIVETGTKAGGSALYLATVCDALGVGEIVTIDIEQADRPSHPRISYLHGSSTNPEIVAEVAARATEPVLVVLDSDHSREHVLNELHSYADLVTPGSYLVVEDTNINGHPVYPSFGPGPMEAVHEFLRERDDFVVDREREKFLLTFNPSGYLRRRR